MRDDVGEEEMVLPRLFRRISCLELLFTKLPRLLVVLGVLELLRELQEILVGRPAKAGPAGHLRF